MKKNILSYYIVSMAIDLKEVERSMKGVYSNSKEKEVALQIYRHISELGARMEEMESRIMIAINMINKHGEVLGNLLKHEKVFKLLEDTHEELENLQGLCKSVESLDGKVAVIEKELDKRFPTRIVSKKKEKSVTLPKDDSEVPPAEPKEEPEEDPFA